MSARFAVFPLVCAVALGRAVFVAAPSPKPRADKATRFQAFTELRGHEHEMRLKAVQDFPTDPWSQDDAFHAFESDRAKSFADGHRIALTDVLDALDDGMRTQRARGDRTMTSSVPPCHPRVIY